MRNPLSKDRMAGLARLDRRQVVSALCCICRWGLGVLLIWSSLHKIRHPYDFLSAVYGYDLTGPTLGVAVAMMLPWLELILGVCLVFRLFAGGALLGACILSVGFLFVQASALYRGLEITCGCFGVAEDVVGYASFLRTLLFAVAASLALGLSVVSVKTSS